MIACISSNGCVSETATKKLPYKKDKKASTSVRYHVLHNVSLNLDIVLPAIIKMIVGQEKHF